MQLQFIGCGDAFGSGGRFNTCLHFTGADTNFLIDCGASSLIAMKQFGVARNDIQSILFTHYHADHFGGLPFFMLDAQFFSMRTEPLVIAGPPGLEKWFERVMETSFPGSSKTRPRFDLIFKELTSGVPTRIGSLRVTPYQVKHGSPGGSCFALRVEAGGRTVAYTGDSEWTDAITRAAQGVDLFVAEAYFRNKKVPLHLDLATLEAHLPRIGAKRVILTHMSDDMLNQLHDVNHETAHDGLVVQF